jgi:hypothetical protein
MSIQDLKSMPAMPEGLEDQIDRPTTEEAPKTFVTLDRLCLDVSVSLFELIRQASSSPDFHKDTIATQQFTSSLAELASIFLWPVPLDGKSDPQQPVIGYKFTYEDEDIETQTKEEKTDIVFTERLEEAKAVFQQKYPGTLSRRQKIIRIEAIRDGEDTASETSS